MICPFNMAVRIFCSYYDNEKIQKHFFNFGALSYSLFIVGNQGHATTMDTSRITPTLLEGKPISVDTVAAVSFIFMTNSVY